MCLKETVNYECGHQVFGEYTLCQYQQRLQEQIPCDEYATDTEELNLLCQGSFRTNERAVEGICRKCNWECQRNWPLASSNTPLASNNTPPASNPLPSKRPLSQKMPVIGEKLVLKDNLDLREKSVLIENQVPVEEPVQMKKPLPGKTPFPGKVLLLREQHWNSLDRTSPPSEPLPRHNPPLLTTSLPSNWTPAQSRHIPCEKPLSSMASLPTRTAQHASWTHLKSKTSVPRSEPPLPDNETPLLTGRIPLPDNETPLLRGRIPLPDWTSLSCRKPLPIRPSPSSNQASENETPAEAKESLHNAKHSGSNIPTQSNTPCLSTLGSPGSTSSPSRKQQKRQRDQNDDDIEEMMRIDRWMIRERKKLNFQTDSAHY